MRSPFLVVLALLLLSPACMRKQALPAPYGDDSTQYFDPGPGFKLSVEAAKQKALAAEREQEASGQAAGDTQKEDFQEPN